MFSNIRKLASEGSQSLPATSRSSSLPRDTLDDALIERIASR